jgi:hypothetical protein
MPENILFVPECHVDTALAQVLLADRLTFINHQKSISKVARVLQAQAESSRGPRFVVGIVDKDKKFEDLRYLRLFNRPYRMHTGPVCRFRIYQHAELASHFLVVLDPACDTWIFDAAHASRLDLNGFGLPPLLADFIAFVKDENAENNSQLRRLLQAISQVQPPAYRELAEFVADVMDQNSKLWQ